MRTRDKGGVLTSGPSSFGIVKITMLSRRPSVRITICAVIALLGSVVPVSAQAFSVRNTATLSKTANDSTARYIVIARSSDQWISLKADLLEAKAIIQAEYGSQINGAQVLLTDSQARSLLNDDRVQSISRDGVVAVDDAKIGDGSEVPGRYIVKLKDSASQATVSSLLTTYSKQIFYVYRNAFTGFAVELSSADLGRLQDDANVESVSQDRFVRTEEEQLNPSWGLDRIDEVALPLDSRYTYASTGSGVDIYVIDSGVQASHPNFGGRVATGYPATGSDDCNGHGTHVAGIAASSTYGVAKEARIIPVKVLDCSGSGTYAEIIAGIDWVISDHQASKKAVANLSLGGPRSSTLNNAVNRLFSDGIVAVSAAGNDNVSACNTSPASATNTLTVAATDSTDTRASFSNYGSCVHVFAPGVSILSTTMASKTGYKSGTSMAAPHVAGAAAVYWASNPTSSASTVRSSLLAVATSGRVSSAGLFSPNKLLYLPPQTGVVPSAPAAPTASFTNGTIAVSWNAPTSTGSNPISSYTVQDNSDVTVCTWTTGPLSCSVAGLSVGTYSFKVAATSASGASEYSPLSNSVTVTTEGNNDFFAAARILMTQSGSINDSNSSASRESGEPITYGVTSATRWYSITPTATGTLYVNTNGSTFDTVVGVFTGTNVSALTPVASDDDSGLDAQSALSVSVTKGTTYRIQVGGYSSSATGLITMEWFISGAGCSTTPSNDAFVCATNITNASGTSNASTVNATIETNEPSAWPSVNSIWYRLMPSDSSDATFDLDGSNFDTVIEVFSSPKINPLFDELTRVVGNDDVSDSDSTSYVTGVPLSAGTYYFVRIAGYSTSTPPSGNVVFSWTISASTPTSVPGSPTDVTATAGASSATVRWTAPVLTGSSAVISYTAVSSPGGLSCTTSTTTCVVSNLQDFVTYTFTVIARNTAGDSPPSLPSNSVTLGYENDPISGAKELTSGIMFSNNKLATLEIGEPEHAGNVGGKSMWFKVSSDVVQSVQISTDGSAFDTVVGVYRATSSQVPVTFAALSEVTSNDDAPGLYGASRVSFLIEPGYIYYVAVDGHGAGVLAESGAIKLATLMSPLSPPSEPINVKIAPSKYGVEVGWKAPLVSASTITSYRATAFPSGESCTSATHLLQCSISGLNPGTIYSVSVVAINPAGVSEPSLRSESFTPTIELASRSLASTWNLDRIDEREQVGDGYMSYVGRGQGVRVYIVDTGLRDTHIEFAGRVATGFSVIDDGRGTSDCHGHGTHVASTAVGSRLGIARDAIVVPVRVLDCDGVGYTSEIIAGLNWISEQVSMNSYRAVVNMSFGGWADDALDAVVNNLIANGIVVVAAAGNDARDACGYSPARTTGAITVGATTSGDAEASFSNFGKCVDLYAPGVGIVGADYRSDQSTITFSGTSMAAPHVTGFAAVVLGILSTSGGSVTPQKVSLVIVNEASSGLLTDVAVSSPNKLLFIGSDRCALLTQAGMKCINSTNTTAPPTTTIPPTTIAPPVVTSPTPLLVTKVNVTKSSSASAIAKTLGVKVPTGAKVSVLVAKTSAKTCKVSRSRLVVLRNGRCSISLTITPKRGAKKTIKKTITVAK